MWYMYVHYHRVSQLKKERRQTLEWQGPTACHIIPGAPCTVFVLLGGGENQLCDRDHFHSPPPPLAHVILRYVFFLLLLLPSSPPPKWERDKGSKFASDTFTRKALDCKTS